MHCKLNEPVAAAMVARMSRILFGAFIPQGWKMELTGIDGAAAKWQKSVDVAVRAEELGYDSIWVYDHFHNVPRPAGEAVFECWTTIAAISQRTTRVRLGQMVGCTSYRQPSVSRQDHVERRCDQRWASRLGNRGRMVRERIQGLRLRIPDGRRIASACCASASRSSRACGPNRRRRFPGSTTSFRAPTVIRSHCSLRTHRSGSVAGENSSRCGSSPVMPTIRTSEG